MINLTVSTLTVGSSSVVSSSSSPAATSVTVNTITNRSSVTIYSSVETTSSTTSAISLEIATAGNAYTNHLSGGGIAGITIGMFFAAILVIVALAYVKRRRSHKHLDKASNQYLPDKEELQKNEMLSALENNRDNVITASDTFQETVPASDYVNVDSSRNPLESTDPSLGNDGYLKTISPCPVKSINVNPSSDINNKNKEDDVIRNNKKFKRNHRSSIPTTSVPTSPTIINGSLAKSHPNRHQDNRNEEIQHLNHLPDHDSQRRHEYVNWNVEMKMDLTSDDDEEKLKELQCSSVNKDVNSKQHQTSFSIHGQGTSLRKYVNMNNNTAGANKAISPYAKSKNIDSEEISNTEINYVNEDDCVSVPESINEIPSQDELYEN